MSLYDLLQFHKFTQNPFASWTAEKEGKDLARWFIRPSFFQDILGNYGNSRELVQFGSRDPQSAAFQTFLQPASHVIFGIPGGGKTATRKMLEAELLAKSPGSAIIRYTDFSRVLVNGINRPSLSSHVNELLRLGTIVLLTLWLESRNRYETLSFSQRAELAGLVGEYYEKLPPKSKDIYISTLSPCIGRARVVAQKTGQTLVDIYNGAVSVLKREKIEPTRWDSSHDAADKSEPMIRLQRFWSLAYAMGIQNIWVLVDGVDEHPDTRSGRTIFNCLAEILLNQRLMEFSEEDNQVMCFKVFLTLPEEIEPLLDAERFRKDRITTRTIQWRRCDLNQALQLRLAHYSNNHIFNFDDLCDQRSKGTHDRLLDECGLNPRMLFLMGYQILASFENMHGKQTRLDKESIDEGIRLAKRSSLPSAAFASAVG